MVSKIIGLAGKSGSGKDVVADYIGDNYGYKKIAVADAIRDECSEFLQLALQRMFSVAEPGYDLVISSFQSMIYEKPTPSGIRVLLQWFGTEYRCSQDPNYWVNILKTRMAENEFVVVSDVRLPVEIDAIHEAGGEVWFVERPGVASVGIPGHLTEIGLDGATFDRTILNDKTLKELRFKVDYIFHES
jgi:hypothetical protein